MLNMLIYRKITYCIVLSKKLDYIHSKSGERAEIELKSNRMTSPPLDLAKPMIIKSLGSVTVGTGRGPLKLWMAAANGLGAAPVC